MNPPCSRAVHSAAAPLQLADRMQARRKRRRQCRMQMCVHVDMHRFTGLFGVLGSLFNGLAGRRSSRIEHDCEYVLFISSARYTRYLYRHGFVPVDNPTRRQLTEVRPTGGAPDHQARRYTDGTADDDLRLRAGHGGESLFQKSSSSGCYGDDGSSLLRWLACVLLLLRVYSFASSTEPKKF